MTEMQERDIFECANQLGGYVGPDTPEKLARFLIRESEEAAKLAQQIVVHREAILTLERERDEAREEVQRCHARLEIDHFWVVGDNDDMNLERVEVPLEERDTQIDGIECRDATISALEQELAAAGARALAAEAQVQALREALAPFASTPDDWTIDDVNRARAALRSEP